VQTSFLSIRILYLFKLVPAEKDARTPEKPFKNQNSLYERTDFTKCFLYTIKYTIIMPSLCYFRKDYNI